MDSEKAIIDTLFYKYKKVGYVLNDDIPDLCIENGIRPTGVDYICKKLIGEGVLITDKVAKEEAIESSSYIDFSQTDYESIYNYTLEVCPGMHFIISEMKKRFPCKKGIR